MGGRAGHICLREDRAYFMAWRKPGWLARRGQCGKTYQGMGRRVSAPEGVCELGGRSRIKTLGGDLVTSLELSGLSGIR